MKKRIPIVICLLLGFSFLPSRVASAGPCLPDSLQGYLNLASPCTLGGADFGDFDLLAGQNGATPINPALIQVTPLGGPLIGFQFTVNQDAGGGDLFESIFSYTASLATFSTAQLLMAGATATGDGVVTVVEDVCVGSLFGPGISGCPAGAQRTNIVFAIEGDSDNSESAVFPPNTFLNVVNDLAVDGGLAGTASVASFTNLFAAAPAQTVVPEPATGLLLAAGLGVVWRRARRSNR
jgi:PEP-CTERM motif